MSFIWIKLLYSVFHTINLVSFIWIKLLYSIFHTINILSFIWINPLYSVFHIINLVSFIWINPLYSSFHTVNLVSFISIALSVIFIDYSWASSDLSASYKPDIQNDHRTWWLHDMEALSALLALCEGNPSTCTPFLRNYSEEIRGTA